MPWHLPCSSFHITHISIFLLLTHAWKDMKFLRYRCVYIQLYNWYKYTYIFHRRDMACFDVLRWNRKEWNLYWPIMSYTWLTRTHLSRKTYIGAHKYIEGERTATKATYFLFYFIFLFILSSLIFLYSLRTMLSYLLTSPSFSFPILLYRSFSVLHSKLWRFSLFFFALFYFVSDFFCIYFAMLITLSRCFLNSHFVAFLRISTFFSFNTCLCFHLYSLLFLLAQFSVSFFYFSFLRIFVAFSSWILFSLVFIF